MTPRTTDWSLALLVALLFGTGMLSLISGRTDSAWVFAAHGIGGAVLGFVTGWKLWRVWRRVVDLGRWDRRTSAGVVATALVVATLLSGSVWSNGGDLYAAGWNLLNWHIGFGIALTLAVGLHGVLRAKPLRGRDLWPQQRARRQALQAGVFALGGATAWWLQRPTAQAIGWRGAQRRWTGSYERDSFRGNAFPATSWIADRPRSVDAGTYQLVVDGLVRSPLRLPLAALHNHARVTATLDCTGGFYSTQHWHGIRLSHLIDQAGALPAATHVRVVSHTGYRWSFPLDQADQLLLATAVGDDLISHAHGAPTRLVAPGYRGFQWIKWVTRIELHSGPDLGAAASTVWSSWTPAGRGEA